MPVCVAVGVVLHLLQFQQLKFLLTIYLPNGQTKSNFYLFDLCSYQFQFQFNLACDHSEIAHDLLFRCVYAVMP